jgi:acetyl-CoA carboxylase carboxyl transferase subunit alpha
MAELKVPIISTIIGEGGSGGALAIAVGNVVMMLQYSTYSVISPEGCASILWRSADKASEAAAALAITADRLKEFGLIDRVVNEPIGGAHRDPKIAIEQVGDAIEEALSTLQGMTPDDLRAQRKERFYAIGREGFA